MLLDQRDDALGDALNHKIPSRTIQIGSHTDASGSATADFTLTQMRANAIRAYLIAYGVARLPIAVSTVLLWTQPLVAAALSWALFGEALGPLAFVGAALVLAGIYVVQRARA